jgi:hypothetical protein
MRDFMAKLVPSILTLIIGTFIGTYVKTWQDAKSGQMRHLDIKVQSTPLITPLSIEGQKLEVLLNGNSIKTLSQVTVEIFNRTDQDYEKIPVYIDLMPTEPTSALRLIRKDVVGNDNLPESITEIQNVNASSSPGGLRKGFTIETANRSGGNPIFKANFLIDGQPMPRPIVTVQKKGVDGKYFYSAYFPVEKKWWQSDTASIIIVLSFYAILLIVLPRLINRIGAKKTEERKNKLKTYVIEKIKNKIEESNQKSDPEFIVHNILFFIERYRWEQTSRLARAVFGHKEPKE